MNVGARDRRQVVAAWVLTVLAVFLIGRWIVGWASSANSGSGRSSVNWSHAAMGKARAKPFDPMVPTLQFSRLAWTEHQLYEASGRNIFKSYGEPQPDKTAPQPRPVPVPSPTPGAPPGLETIGLKLFGIARVSGLARKACLSQEGDVFIGGEGDIVDRRYKLLRVESDAVEVQDLLGNDKYTLTLGR